jgi:hypothetical protein
VGSDHKCFGEWNVKFIPEKETQKWDPSVAVAVLTGHAPVRRHLYIMGLFDGDPTSRFCGMENETVQHMTCHCEVLACQRYNVFGTLSAEAKDIRTASVRDLCLFIGGTGLLNLR